MIIKTKCPTCDGSKDHRATQCEHAREQWANRRTQGLTGRLGC